ncbi:hypothetical protein C8J55DRAFT_493959 [Lentinula edodes]|uniref:Uncharacterized protein n=1 Tax=Lentinula lateritia TaxID=40482 RepID=A0A9W9DDR5_9AGAR|nr:hypothetical protein C8J55DRAFT_493959 [Lentinula edodes]
MLSGDGVEGPEDPVGEGCVKALGDTKGKGGVFECLKDLKPENCLLIVRLGSMGDGGFGDGGSEHFANLLFFGSGLFRDNSLTKLSIGALGLMGNVGPEGFANLKRGLFFFSGIFRDNSVTKESTLNPGSSSTTQGEVQKRRMAMDLQVQIRKGEKTCNFFCPRLYGFITRSILWFKYPFLWDC